MSDAMIRVPQDVRDRLAEIAADQGTSIGTIVTSYARATLTRREREERARATREVLHDLSGYNPTSEQEAEAEAELLRRMRIAAR